MGKKETEREETAKMHLTEGQKDTWRQDKGLQSWSEQRLTVTQSQ